MIVLNFANMMRSVIGVNGLDEKVLDDLKGRVSEEHKEIADRKWKELEFMDLPDRDTSEIKKIGSQVRHESDTFLVLGIGGSALGPRAVLEGLSPFHNLREKPGVFIYDNVDPRTLKGILSLALPGGYVVPSLREVEVKSTVRGGSGGS